MNGLPQGEQRQAKRAKTLKLPCAEVRIYVRNQQVAGSSPASSSTDTRFSHENRVYCLQKRLKNGVFPPLWPKYGLGQNV